MKKRDIREKAADLFKKDPGPGEEEDIINALENDGMTREEIDSLKAINSGLDHVFEGEPGEQLDKRFYSMLKDESSRSGLHEIQKSSFKQTWMLAAAGIALFILGWFSASWYTNSSGSNNQIADLSGEVRELKETLVLTMMSQSSSTERIKAVNMAVEFDNAGTRIIDNLFKVLNSDNNDNVRLLALEALIKYSGNQEVRQGLVSSIVNQTSPMIQLRMTEIMTALNEKSAAAEFRKVLNDASLNYSVRTRMEEAVVTLL